jgi:hypothetical protein
MRRAQSQNLSGQQTTRIAMNNSLRQTACVGSLLATLAVAGCSSDQTGSPYHPGPVAGTVIGEGAGVVAGNAVGFAGGVVTGAIDGTRKVLNPSYRMVRYWKTTTTPDGRTIQVPYDILVDEYGRPAHMPAPTGRPAPPPMAPVFITNAPAK